MSKISKIHARQILDSRGLPTLEVEVFTERGFMGRAAVPSGASTGAHEATELRDHDPHQFLGKGVTKAVRFVNSEIEHLLLGREVKDQLSNDQLLIKLDGTEQKSRLGANAILGTSLALAKAAAQEAGLPLYRYIGGSQARVLPVPLLNVINGGAHANNGVDVQEFMLVPVCGGRFDEALRAGAEVFQTLKKVLDKKGFSIAVGDEGGFAPPLKSNRQALEMLSEAVEQAGYKLGEDIGFALDVAATELFGDNLYQWEGKKISGDELTEVYRSWAQEFPLWSIEDGCSEDDWDTWSVLTRKLGDKIQLVGDDLFVTNTNRLAEGIRRQVANALLVKVNQIGTLSETAEAVQLAQRNKYQTVMSHRSGETEDATIADLAVAFNCGQIKTGSLCRGERTAKYNQLLRIADELGASQEFMGKSVFLR